MKKYMLGFMLISCLLSVLFVNTNIAKAGTAKEAIELITGNNRASWISMDDSRDVYRFTNDMVTINAINRFDLKGYSDISFYCKGDAPMTMHIQYNANDNVYYGYIFFTASGSPVNSNTKSGYYRALK